MQKLLLTAGSILGMLAVIIGAFGAHSLRAKITPDQLQTFETGSRYHFYHVIAIFISVWIAAKTQQNIAFYGGVCFLIGIFLFSGSIYLLATRSVLGIEGKWLGPVTPVGGLFFIAGWALILVSIFKAKNL